MQFFTIILFFFRYANVLSYIEPFQVVKEYWVRGEKAAMASGDICWACLNRVNFALALFLSGSNLSVVREECEKASQVSYHMKCNVYSNQKFSFVALLVC